MTNHLFVSYKSEENQFTLKLAADLKNRGIGVWVDRLDGGIEVGDQWTKALGDALATSMGMIVVLTKDYFKSRVCLEELDFAFRKDIPVFPVHLRRWDNAEQKVDIPFWLDGRQWLDFTNWLNEKDYLQQVERLTNRIRSENSDVQGAIPSAEIQYLTTLIAELEGHQGVENYIALAGQADEIVRPNPRLHKGIDPSLAVLLGNQDQERENTPLERKPIADIHEAVAQHPRFVLIGDPGAGKTTTLRRLALEQARERKAWLEQTPEAPTTEPAIPFIVYLPRWDNEPSASEFVRGQWTLGGDILARLQQGKSWLYLDGLNEMGATGGDKAKLLKQWFHSPKAPQHAMITCRQGNYLGELDLSLPTILVEPLSNERIRAFTTQYLGEKADGFLPQIFPEYKTEREKNRKEDRSLLHLARNPYLLAALTLLYEAGGNLPHNTGALFSALVMALWERERLYGTPNWIPLAEIEVAFGRLAFDIISSQQPIDIPLDYAITQLGNEILIQLGKSASFISQTDNKVRFYHQLMLEYFAAVSFPMELLANLLPTPKFVPFTGRQTTIWDKVLIARCGLVRDKDQFLCIIQQIDPYLVAECIQSGIQVDVITKSRFINVLIEKLDDEDRGVRGAAAIALGRISDSQAVPALLEALQDSANEVRSSAALALGRIGDSQVVPVLVEALSDEDLLTRNVLARSLGKFGKPIFSILLKALENKDSRVRTGAAQALGYIGDIQALPALLKVLNDEDKHVRRGVIEALGNIDDQQAILALVTALRDESSVRIYIMRELIRVENKYFPLLLEALQDEDVDIRRGVAQALGKIGNPQATKALITLLGDTNETRFKNRVCDIAAEALKKIGTSEAVKAVRQWKRRDKAH